MAQNILGRLGNVRYAQRRHQEALHLYEQALDSAVRTDNKRSQAAWLNALGGVHSALGDYQRAVEFQLLSRELGSETGDVRHVADTESNLGSTRLLIGEPQAAWQHFSNAFQIYRSIFGADHPRTRQAKESLDELAPLAPSLFLIQRADGKTFDLRLANGKYALPVFTASETACRVRDLLLERFGGPLPVVEAKAIPREVLESTLRPTGVSADGLPVHLRGCAILPSPDRWRNGVPTPDMIQLHWLGMFISTTEVGSPGRLGMQLEGANPKTKLAIIEDWVGITILCSRARQASFACFISVACHAR